MGRRIGALALVFLTSGVSRAALADEGTFEDRRGDVRDFAPTYDAWFSPSRHRRYVLPAILESGAVVSMGLLYYWVDPLANSEDWDDPSFSDRLNPSRTLRFDTNLNTTNHLLHPVAGAAVYTIGRVNGLRIPEAFLLSAAWSSAWEFALEWREKPSINDLVYTSVGGVPLGELATHLGDYLASAPAGGGTAQRIAAWSLGAPRSAHRRLYDEPDPGEPMPADELGFSSAYGHAFATGYDFAMLSNDRGDRAPMHRVRLAATIVDIPGFLRPGTFATTFANGNFTDLRLRVGVGAGANDEADLQVRATLVGRYEQSIEEDDEGALHGHATMLGVGPALRFDATSWLGRRDQLSAVHVVGPRGDVWLALGDFRAHFGADAYADFASIQSLAYHPYTGEHGAEGTKSVLQRQGYQYAYGATGRLEGDLAWQSLSLSSSLVAGRWESIEGADRFQERITDDVHGTEDALELAVDASVRVASIVELGAGWATRIRESRLGDVTVRRWDRDVHLHAGLVF